MSNGEVKFHINNDNKVLRCRASSRSCHFKGDMRSDGTDSNHFLSKEEAQKIADKRNEETYPQYNQGIAKTRSRKTSMAITKMTKEGMDVHEISVMKNSFDKVSSSIEDPEKMLVSFVDIVDEKPSKDFLEKIRSGEVSAFEKA